MQVKDYCHIGAAVIIAVSLAANIYLGQAFVKKQEPVIVYKDKIIEKPYKVVEVKTEYVIKEKIVERPTTVNVPAGSTTESVLLAELESAIPDIGSDPFLIIENQKHQWEFPNQSNHLSNFKMMKISLLYLLLNH